MNKSWKPCLERGLWPFLTLSPQEAGRMKPLDHWGAAEQGQFQMRLQ